MGVVLVGSLALTVAREGAMWLAWVLGAVVCVVIAAGVWVPEKGAHTNAVTL